MMDEQVAVRNLKILLRAACLRPARDLFGLARYAFESSSALELRPRQSMFIMIGRF